MRNGNGEHVFFDAKQLIVNEVTSVGRVESLTIDSKLYQTYLGKALECNKTLLSVKVGVGCTSQKIEQEFEAYFDIDQIISIDLEANNNRRILRCI